MIGKEVVDKRAVSLTEVEEILIKQQKQYTLNYEQEAALKHAKQFALDSAKAKKLVQKLQETARLSEEAVAKITDIRPKNLPLLKMLLAQTKEALGEEELTKILGIVKECS